jgi:hypothetical protein
LISVSTWSISPLIFCYTPDSLVEHNRGKSDLLFRGQRPSSGAGAPPQRRRHLPLRPALESATRRME